MAKVRVRAGKGRAARRELAAAVAARRESRQRLYAEAAGVLDTPARTVAGRQEVLSRTQREREGRRLRRAESCPTPPAQEEPRELFRVRSDDELTAEQSAAIESYLREKWRNPMSGEMHRDCFGAALREGFLVLACRWTFSFTDAEDLAELLEGLGLAVHPQPAEDEWNEFDEKFSMDCPHCLTRLYAERDWGKEEPADGDWPDSCHNCYREVPNPHHTAVMKASDGTFFAYCSCEWVQDGSVRTAAGAKGVGTRHRNRELAAQQAEVAPEPVLAVAV